MNIFFTFCFLIISTGLAYHQTNHHKRDYEKASWNKAVSNYFASSTPGLLLQILGITDHSASERIAGDTANSAGASLGLDTSGNWIKAFTKTIARQSIFGNVVSESLKAVTRIIGWGFMTLVLYGNVFERRRRSISDHEELPSLSFSLDRIIQELQRRGLE